MDQTNQQAGQPMETVGVPAQQEEFGLRKAFHDGGEAMYFIAIVGIATIVLTISRLMAFAKMSVSKEDVQEKIFGFLTRGDVRQAISYCDNRPTPMTNAVKSGLVQVLNKRPDEEVQVAMDAAVLRETPKVEGWTGFLAVFANVATLIGLLGTIIGLIKSFAALSKADETQKALLLAEGISHALNCTGFGLIVAIIALVSFGYFQVRISRMLNDVAETSMTLMNLVVSNRDKIKD